MITWETTQPSGAARFNRAHWIVIDSIGAFGGDSPLDDPNLIASQPRPDFGARSIGNHINRVMPGSNAERMGLKAGDALVRLNDQTVHVAVDVEEIVTRFALECIRGLIESGRSSVDVTEDAYWRYNAEVDRIEKLRTYMDPRVHNYYKNDFGRSSGMMSIDVRLFPHRGKP